MEEELESARQLQMSMVPTMFPQPTAQRPIEIFAMMEPAREVGGDLYDFYDIDDGTLCFFIGDVSGKGVPAALFMARTKNVIRLVIAAAARCGRVGADARRYRHRGQPRAVSGQCRHDVRDVVLRHA